MLHTHMNHDTKTLLVNLHGDHEEMMSFCNSVEGSVKLPRIWKVGIKLSKYDSHNRYYNVKTLDNSKPIEL